jgi:hypothetical protein
VLGALLLSGCGAVDSDQGPSQENSRGNESPGHAKAVEVDAAGSQRDVELLTQVASEGDAQFTLAMELGDPPGENLVPLEGFVGKRWLHMDVSINDPEGNRAEAYWEASMIAGDVRATAAAEGLDAPFGYSITGVLPDGTREEPYEIMIGAPISDQPRVVKDPEAESVRIQEATRDLGLKLDAVEFKGTEPALVVRVSAEEDRRSVIDRWREILQGLIGEHQSASWYVEVADADNRVIKAIGQAETSGAVRAWTAPDLREYELGSE